MFYQLAPLEMLWFDWKQLRWENVNPFQETVINTILLFVIAFQIFELKKNEYFSEFKLSVSSTIRTDSFQKWPNSLEQNKYRSCLIPSFFVWVETVTRSVAIIGYLSVYGWVQSPLQ